MGRPGCVERTVDAAAGLALLICTNQARAALGVLFTFRLWQIGQLAEVICFNWLTTEKRQQATDRAAGNCLDQGAPRRAACRE
jgi:hypothetical protein